MPTNCKFDVSFAWNLHVERHFSYLLEEHEARTNMGSTPAALLEAVAPRHHLELQLFHGAAIDERRMTLCQDPLLKFGFRDDL